MIGQLYKKLMKCYGPQGWWPLHGIGYHPEDYSFPKDDRQPFEICIGCILTQNTSWKNVEMALSQLHGKKLMDCSKILEAAKEDLAEIIRSSGYFNQKAEKLKRFCLFLKRHSLKGINTMDMHEARKLLLAVHGIGPETADSILLYACKRPVFVVDAYTKRIFQRWGIIPANASYEDIQILVHRELRPDVRDYQEFHALLVRHAKKHYQKKPYGITDDIFLKKRKKKEMIKK
jgi:endonuclease-3 related protein